MPILKGLREMPEFTAQPEVARKPMRDGEGLAELRAMSRILNLLIEDCIGVDVKPTNVGGDQKDCRLAIGTDVEVRRGAAKDAPEVAYGNGWSFFGAGQKHYLKPGRDIARII